MTQEWIAFPLVSSIHEMKCHAQLTPTTAFDRQHGMNRQQHMWLWALLLFATSIEAQAHRVNISQSIWHAWPGKGAVEMTLRIAPADIQQILLRTPVPWAYPLVPASEEWRKHAQQMLQDNMAGSNDGQSCRIQALDARIEHDLVVRFRWLCPPPIRAFVAQLHWLDALPAAHSHRLRAYKEGRLDQQLALSGAQHTHRWSFESKSYQRKPTPPIRPTPTIPTAVKHTFYSGFSNGFDPLLLSGYPLLFALGLLLTRQPPKQLVQITSVWTVSQLLTASILTLASVVPSGSFLGLLSASTVPVVAFFTLRVSHHGWRTGVVFLLGILHGLDLLHHASHAEMDWTPLSGYLLCILAGQWLTIWTLYPIARWVEKTRYWHRARVISAVFISTAALVWGSLTF